MGLGADAASMTTCQDLRHCMDMAAGSRLLTVLWVVCI